MAVFSGPLQALIDEMGRLPGIGPKSAQRITFHLLKVAPEDAMRLAEARRAGSGAIPCPGFKGLPGDTSHHISSSPSARIANRLICRWL